MNFYRSTEVIENNFLDATRISDGAQVYLKRLFSQGAGEAAEAGFNELHILEFLQNEPLKAVPCVPLLDRFPFVDGDSNFVGYNFIVMPLLRDWKCPQSYLSFEALDFVKQMLEVRV